MKSKFNNPTEQKIEILEEYIHVKVSGIITTGSSVENFLNISRIVEKTGKNKLLLESQFENTLSIDQTYQVFEELKSLNIRTLFEAKTAFLPVVDQFEYYVLYTDALTAQNILAKVFKEKEIALDWLLIKT